MDENGCIINSLCKDDFKIINYPANCIFTKNVTAPLWLEITKYVYRMAIPYKITTASLVSCMESIHVFLREFEFINPYDDATPKTIMILAISLAWTIIKIMARSAISPDSLFLEDSPMGITLDDWEVIREWESAIVSYTGFSNKAISMLDIGLKRSIPTNIVYFNIKQSRHSELRMVCKCVCASVSMDMKSMSMPFITRTLASSYLSYFLVILSHGIDNDGNIIYKNVSGRDSLVIPFSECVDMMLIKYWVDERFPKLITEFKRFKFPCFEMLSNVPFDTIIVRTHQ